MEGNKDKQARGAKILTNKGKDKQTSEKNI